MSGRSTRWVATSAFAAAVLCVPSLAGSYAGAVYGPDSLPLAGVVVTDPVSGLADTTGGDGAFVVGGSCLVSVLPRHAVVASGSGLLGPWYDLSGRVLRAGVVASGPAAAQASAVAMGRTAAPAVYVARRNQSGPAGQVGASAVLAKAAECTGDTLVFALDGYVTKRVFAADTAGIMRVYMAQGGLFSVTAAQAYALVTANAGDAGFVIIDVRRPSEFATGHLAGAVNIDYYSATFA